MADAGSAFAGYVAEEAPAVAGRLRDGAEDLLERVKETVAAGAQAVEEAADAAQAAAAEEATEQAEAAAQAEEKPEKGTAAEAATEPGNRAAAGKIKKTPPSGSCNSRAAESFLEAKNISQTLLPGVK